ncbi:MAG: cupin domain-containing protein [Alphaproteobacteria bacterium]
MSPRADALAGSETAFDPTGTFIDLRPDGGASAVPVTDSFWADLASGALAIDGRLFSAFRMTADWDHWEMHPAGPELLFLASGACELVCEDRAGRLWRVAMAAEQAYLVPAGAWHRAEIRTPGLLLALTQGDGTQHRPL